MSLHSHTELLDRVSMSQRLLDEPDAEEVPILPFLVLDQQLDYGSSPTAVERSRRWLPAKIGGVSLGLQGNLSASH